MIATYCYNQYRRRAHLEILHQINYKIYIVECSIIVASYWVKFHNKGIHHTTTQGGTECILLPSLGIIQCTEKSVVYSAQYEVYWAVHTRPCSVQCTLEKVDTD